MASQFKKKSFFKVILTLRLLQFVIVAQSNTKAC